MSAGRVSNCNPIAERAAGVRARFEAHGINVSAWARQRVFPVKAVHAVLSGTRPCRWGQSHAIAVALGIKDAPADDGDVTAEFAEAAE